MISSTKLQLELILGVHHRLAIWRRSHVNNRTYELDYGASARPAAFRLVAFAFAADSQRNHCVSYVLMLVRNHAATQRCISHNAFRQTTSGGPPMDEYGAFT